MFHELPIFKVGDMGVGANARLMKEWRHTISAETAETLITPTFSRLKPLCLQRVG